MLAPDWMYNGKHANRPCTHYSSTRMYTINYATSQLTHTMQNRRNCNIEKYVSKDRVTLIPGDNDGNRKNIENKTSVNRPGVYIPWDLYSPFSYIFIISICTHIHIHTE